MATGDLYIKKDGVYTPVTPHVYRGARGEPETALYIVDRNKLAGALNYMPLPFFIRDPICFTNLGADWSRLWVFDRNQLPVNAEVVWWDEVNNFAIVYVQCDIQVISQLNWYKFDYKAGNSVNPSIGGIGSAPGQAVWDTPDDFWKGVYHLTQDTSGGEGSILDSTKNAKHATPIGYTGNAVEVYNGLPCTRFNGIDQYIVTVEHIVDLAPTDTYFNEGIFSHAGGDPDKSRNGPCIITQEYDGSDLQYGLGYHNNATDGLFRTFFIKTGTSAVHYEELTDNPITDMDSWHYVIGQYNKVRMQLYFNDDFTDHARTTTLAANQRVTHIGRRYNTSGDPFFDGVIHLASVGLTHLEEVQRTSLRAARLETLFDVYLGEAAPAGWEPVEQVYHKHKGLWRIGATAAYLQPQAATSEPHLDTRSPYQVYTSDGLGHPDDSGWMISGAGAGVTKKINADFGDPQYFEYFEFNNFNLNGYTTRGIETLTIYGTNDPDAYANVTTGDLTDLTQMATGTLVQHSGDSSQLELQRVDIDGPQQLIAYRYIVIECTNFATSDGGLGLSKINAFIKVPDYGS